MYKNLRKFQMTEALRRKYLEARVTASSFPYWGEFLKRMRHIEPDPQMGGVDSSPT